MQALERKIDLLIYASMELVVNIVLNASVLLEDLPQPILPIARKSTDVLAKCNSHLGWSHSTKLSSAHAI